MSEAKPGPPPSRLIRVLGALVLPAAMIFLFVFLSQKCSAGHDAIDHYVASVRAGTDVTPEIGGDEAEALTSTLRSSTSVGVQNFIGQGGTVCYYVSISGPSGSVDGRFLLTDDTVMHVVAASLSHPCNCPPNSRAPCYMAR